MSSLENTVGAAPPKERRVSILLGAGIFLLPLVFAWFTLRRGHSVAARVVSFGWLLVTVIALGSGSGDAGGASTTGSDGRTFSQVATDTLVEPQMNAITDKVARDAADQYRISLSGGDRVEICVHAGMVAAAYLQAKDQPNYLEWKDREKRDCAAAGLR